MSAVPMILEILSARKYSVKNMDQIQLYNRIKDNNLFGSTNIYAILYLKKIFNIDKENINPNDLLNIDNIDQLRINIIDEAVVCIIKNIFEHSTELTDCEIFEIFLKINFDKIYKVLDDKYYGLELKVCLDKILWLSRRYLKANPYDGGNSSYSKDTRDIAKAYYNLMYKLYSQYEKTDEYCMLMAHNYSLLYSQSDIELSRLYNNGYYESK